MEPITLHANGLSFPALSSSPSLPEGEAPIALCLHGFPDHMRSFRFQLPALAAAGYRAIAPCLRGYDPASQPSHGDYHIVRMAEDVVAQIDFLRADRVHLIGHDWGAVIGYAAAALAPERFHSLTTLAMPHPGRMQRDGLRQFPGQLRNSWYMMFFQLRGIADFVVERNDWAFIERLWRDWSPGWDLPEEELRIVKRALAQPGVKKAALAYYRSMFGFAGRAARATRRLLGAKIPVPTLALTGALDGCMDTRLHDVAMRDEDFPAGFKMVRIRDAGHFLHQEKPEEVNRLLLGWLKRNDTA